MNRKKKAIVAKNLLLNRSCGSCAKLHTMGEYYATLRCCNEYKNSPKRKVCAEWEWFGREIINE